MSCLVTVPGDCVERPKKPSSRNDIALGSRTRKPVEVRGASELICLLSEDVLGMFTVRVMADVPQSFYAR